jgi:hypothetical protein
MGLKVQAAAPAARVARARAHCWPHARRPPAPAPYASPTPAPAPLQIMKLQKRIAGAQGGS